MYIENNGNKIKYLRKDICILKLIYLVILRVEI